MKKKTNFILIIVSIIMVVICAAVYISYRINLSSQKERYEMVQSNIDELRKEKEELEEQLAKLDEDAEETKSNEEKPRVILCLNNLSDDLYDSIYSVMVQKRCKAAIVSLGGVVPGNTGRISVDHCKELLSEKWGCALGAGSNFTWDSEKAKNIDSYKSFMEGYISSYKNTMKKTPDAIYFTDNTYSTEYDDMIKELGFSVVFYEGDFVRTRDKSLTIVHVQSNPSNDEIINTFENGQITGIKVELSQDAGTTSASYYTQETLKYLLDRISSGANDGIFKRTDFIKLKSKAKESTADEEIENMDRSELIESIEAIEEQIREIYMDEEI
ncbi:MAG: hypothetical protein MJ097_08090 [Dorea sp.]|nr:hypothetical protein [Dorea sp.]